MLRVKLVGDGEVGVIRADIEVDDDPVLGGLDDARLDRAVDASGAEHKLEPVDAGGQILEHALSFGDLLLLEPLEHPAKLRLIELNPWQDGVVQTNPRANSLLGSATSRAKVVAGYASFLEAHDEVFFADLGIVEVEPVAPRIHRVKFFPKT